LAQICDSLKPSEKCIRLKRYNHGEGDLLTELFHEHFPSHRISENAQIEMMKAMLLTYGKAEAPYILRCYLNDHGREPPHYDAFRFSPPDLQDGWLRLTCRCGDFEAWLESSF